MALFNKHPNEAAYVGGKKHWTDVIKNSGPGELLIWRHPELSIHPIHFSRYWDVEVKKIGANDNGVLYIII